MYILLLVWTKVTRNPIGIAIQCIEKKAQDVVEGFKQSESLMLGRIVCIGKVDGKMGHILGCSNPRGPMQTQDKMGEHQGWRRATQPKSRDLQLEQNQPHSYWNFGLALLTHVNMRANSLRRKHTILRLIGIS